MTYRYHVDDARKKAEQIELRTKEYLYSKNMNLVDKLYMSYVKRLEYLNTT